MKKGSVVLIPFPFTDLRGSKVRPAVVLCRNELDVTICFVTSELRWKSNGDVFINPTQSNGLKAPSLIRVGKIATINIDLLLGELGELSNADIIELNNGLKELLQLY